MKRRKNGLCFYFDIMPIDDDFCIERRKDVDINKLCKFIFLPILCVFFFSSFVKRINSNEMQNSVAFTKLSNARIIGSSLFCCCCCCVNAVGYNTHSEYWWILDKRITHLNRYGKTVGVDYFGQSSENVNPFQLYSFWAHIHLIQAIHLKQWERERKTMTAKTRRKKIRKKNRKNKLVSLSIVSHFDFDCAEIICNRFSLCVLYFGYTAETISRHFPHNPFYLLFSFSTVSWPQKVITDNFFVIFSPLLCLDLLNNRWNESHTIVCILKLWINLLGIDFRLFFVMLIRKQFITDRIFSITIITTMRKFKWSMSKQPPHHQLEIH